MATPFSYEDHISCSLCLEVFTDPRNLPCGHTFCCACLQSHITSSSNNNTFLCPQCRGVVNITVKMRPSASSAKAFPRNLALRDAIKTISELQLKNCDPLIKTEKDPQILELHSLCEKLKSSKQILKCLVGLEVERLQRQIDISVAETSDEIDRRGNELIYDFTVAVRNEQDITKNELQTRSLATNKEITKLDAELENLIEESTTAIQLVESILQSESLSNIQNCITKCNKVLQIISDYLDKTRSLAPDIKFTLTKFEKANTKMFSTALGSIVTPDVKSISLSNRMKGDKAEICRKSDKLTHSKTFNMFPLSEKLLLIRDVLVVETVLVTVLVTVLCALAVDILLVYLLVLVAGSIAGFVVVAKAFPSIMIALRYLFRSIWLGVSIPVLWNIPKIMVLADISNKIIVLDQDNNCVKCFSSETLGLQSKYRFPCQPTDLAKTNKQQIVVTLPRKHQITYLNIQNNICLIRTFRTERPYDSISLFPDNRLAVSGSWPFLDIEIHRYMPTYVDILNEEGYIIWSCPRGIIPPPLSVTVNDNFLIVATEIKTAYNEYEVLLISLTATGRIKWVACDPDMVLVNDTACDMDGFFYACDSLRNCVVQVSREGEIIRNILTDMDGLVEPVSVSCDQDNFYVIQNNGDIKIFTWLKA